MNNRPEKKIYEKGYFWLIVLAIGIAIWWQITLVFEEKVNKNYIGETQTITESLDREIKDLKGDITKLDYRKISVKLDENFQRYEDLSQKAYDLKAEIIENEKNLAEELNNDKNFQLLEGYISKNNDLKDEFTKLYKDFAIISEEADLDGDDLEKLEDIIDLGKLASAYRIMGKEKTEDNLIKWKDNLQINSIEESKVEQQLADGHIQKSKFEKINLDKKLIK